MISTRGCLFEHQLFGVVHLMGREGVVQRVAFQVFYTFGSCFLFMHVRRGGTQGQKVLLRLKIVYSGLFCRAKGKQTNSSLPP